MKKLLLYSIILLCSNARATDFFISNSGTGSGTSLSPWSVASFLANYRASTAPGNRYFFKRGDVFSNKIPKVDGTVSQRIYFGAYGSGAQPIFNNFSIIKPAAWSLTGTSNVWKVIINNSANVTGYVPTGSNCGLIMVDGVIHGIRRGLLANLHFQWDFFCDFAGSIYVYSVGNPSGLGTTIKVSNGSSDKIYQMGNYTTTENIDIIGNADAAFNLPNPQYDTIRYCKGNYIGGEFKTLTDTTKQGEGVQFVYGGKGSVAMYNSMVNVYECSYTMQVHPAATITMFDHCKMDHNFSDSCESSWNPTVDAPGSGYIACTFQYNYSKNDGRGWSHPPAKPTDNQSISNLSNGMQTTQLDLEVSFDTIYNPLEGVYYIGNGANIPYTTHDNDIWIDSLTYVRKNAPGGAIKFTWQYKEGANGTWHAVSTQDLNTTWHCLDCHVIGLNTYYRDADGDGYGDPGTTSAGTVQPSGYVNNSLDCNDADVTINPQTTWYLDADADGYWSIAVKSCTTPGTGYTRTITGGGDCNDNNAAINPGAAEACDGIDNNCDGFVDNSGVQILYYRDADGDGYGDPANPVLSCAVPANYVSNNTDCNDNNVLVNPGVTEICGNGIDDNCNGQIDEGCGTNPGIFIADTTINESDGTIYVRIYLSALNGADVKVDYYSVDGTATFPRDFKQVKSTAVIPAGSLSVLVPIKIVYDKILEPTEIFSVLLKNPVNGLISDNQGDISIINTP